MPVVQQRITGDDIKTRCARVDTRTEMERPTTAAAAATRHAVGDAPEMRTSSCLFQHPARGLFKRDGFIHIRYADRAGKIIRESTEQTSVALAEDILRKRKIEVREGKEFPATRFAHVRFSELHAAWWKTVPATGTHKTLGKRTRAGFEYRNERILTMFGSALARAIETKLLRRWLCDLVDDEGKPLSASSRVAARRRHTSSQADRRRSTRFRRGPIAGTSARSSARRRGSQVFGMLTETACESTTSSTSRLPFYSRSVSKTPPCERSPAIAQRSCGATSTCCLIYATA